MFRRFLLVPAVLASLAGCGAAHGDATAPASPVPLGASATAGVSAGPAVVTSVSPEQGGDASAMALTGVQHAFLTSVDTGKGAVTFDLVEWFEGAQAAAACKEDGETETANDRCTGYYYRNRSHQLRTLQVKPGATLRVLREGAELTTADLAKVRVAIGARHSLWKLEVTGGEITRAEEIYLP